MSVCKVCGDLPWKYKTPCCKIRYCSKECYREHFEVVGCEGVRAETEAEKEKRLLVVAEDELRKKEIVDDDTVSSKQLEALSRDPTIRSQLRDNSLQELVKNIDGNLDREGALQDAMEATPEFRSFMDHVANILVLNETITKRKQAETNLPVKRLQTDRLQQADQQKQKAEEQQQTLQQEEEELTL